MDSDDRDRPRNSTVLILGLGSLVFGFLWFASWSLFAGNSWIHANDIKQLASFSPYEAQFFLAATVVEVVLAAGFGALLARAWRPAWDARWKELLAKPDQTYAVLAACAAAFAFVMGLGVIGGHPITEDEKTYLYQAHLLLEGKLSEPVPPEATAFWQPFIVHVGPNWSGQYFWAQPLFLAVGLLAHAPIVVPPIELAVTVFFTGKLAAQYARDDRVGVLAALLAAVSPLLIFTAGTLHTANLSAACAATSLFALARLAEKRDLRATVLLGVAVGISFHNRLLDEAALLLGGAVLLAFHFRDNLRGLLRAIGPSLLVAAPFLAVTPFVNRAAWGGYTTTGYSLFNGRWKTMGFGLGPFGTEHTVPIAAAKTITVLVRVAFYETGSPLGFALLALPLLGVFGGVRRQLAPFVLIASYCLAYFYYAGSSIDPTGPVYYLGLTPVLLGCIALVAVDLHDRVRGTRFRRAVPAFLVAQSLAGLVVFWPPEIGYLKQDVAQAKQCETLLADAGISRGLVFALFGPYSPSLHTWHRRPPFPWPPFDAPLLYAHGGGVEKDAEAARKFAGDRPVYLARCLSPEPTALLRYDPEARTVSALDGSDTRHLETNKPGLPELVSDYYPLFKVW